MVVVVVLAVLLLLLLLLLLLQRQLPLPIQPAGALATTTTHMALTLNGTLRNICLGGSRPQPHQKFALASQAPLEMYSRLHAPDECSQSPCPLIHSSPWEMRQMPSRQLHEELVHHKVTSQSHNTRVKSLGSQGSHRQVKREVTGKSVGGDSVGGKVRRIFVWCSAHKRKICLQ